MTSAQYITVRETSQLLGITEKKVMDLVDEGGLQAYRIAGQFLRLKKSEVLNLFNSGTVANETIQYQYSTAERITDFFYYNDFYIIAFAIITGLLYIILYL